MSTTATIGPSARFATGLSTPGTGFLDALSLPMPGVYTIQVAAIAEPANARGLLGELKRVGLDAYLVEPSTDAADQLYRVRVGKYESRSSAQRAVTALESRLGVKLWVTRTR